MSMLAVLDAAQVVRAMLASPAEPSGEDLWRFGVLQFLDDHESTRRHHGVSSRRGCLVTIDRPLCP